MVGGFISQYNRIGYKLIRNVIESTNPESGPAALRKHCPGFRNDADSAMSTHMSGKLGGGYDNANNGDEEKTDADIAEAQKEASGRQLGVLRTDLRKMLFRLQFYSKDLEYEFGTKALSEEDAMRDAEIQAAKQGVHWKDSLEVGGDTNMGAGSLRGTMKDEMLDEGRGFHSVSS